MKMLIPLVIGSLFSGFVVAEVDGELDPDSSKWPMATQCAEYGNYITSEGEIIECTSESLRAEVNRNQAEPVAEVDEAEIEEAEVEEADDGEGDDGAADIPADDEAEVDSLEQ